MNLQTISQEIERHHRLFITAIIVLVLLLGWRKWVAHEDGLAHDQRVLADSNLKQIQDSNKAKDDQQAKQDKAFQDLSAQVTAANQQSQAQIAALKTSLQQQQAKDSTMALPDLGTRWQGMIGVQPSDVKASSDGVTVTDTAARNTVTQLEEIPVDRQTIATQQTIINRDDQQIAACQSDINGLHEQVGGKNAEIKAAKDACEAEKKELKASARKSKWRWFLGGIAAGATAAVKLVL